MCFFWVACPLPGKLARVGGHRRQPVLNPLMSGILDRMACGVALALAIGGRGAAADPPPTPEAKKRLFFEECSMRIKHRKYRQKWPLGGVGLGQGAGAQKS